MKLYLFVDMEGIFGLLDEIFVNFCMYNYECGRVLMIEEVNWCIVEVFNNGCMEVIVNDSYLKMNNLFVEKFYFEVELIIGDVKLFFMMQGFDEFYFGVMFIGYYVRVLMLGVMLYSMIFGVCYFYINDKLVGELGLNVYFVGFYDVLVIMAVGDDCVVKEVEELILNVMIVVVK